MDECCYSCWFRQNGSETSYEQYAPCRRFPPTNEMRNGLQMKYPMVARGAWCGEYRPISTPSQESKP